MSRRHPAVVWLSAELARTKGVGDRAAARLATETARLERARQQVMRLEQVCAQLAKTCDAARIRADALGATLRHADQAADPSALAAVHGWKEVHAYAWTNRRLTALLQAAGAEYVSTTDLADTLACELDLHGTPLFEPVRWRANVRYALRFLREQGKVEHVYRRRASDSQTECCWRLKQPTSLARLRTQASALGIGTAHVEVWE